MLGTRILRRADKFEGGGVAQGIQVGEDPNVGAQVCHAKCDFSRPSADPTMALRVDSAVAVRW